jgi:hypothetical protein
MSIPLVSPRRTLGGQVGRAAGQGAVEGEDGPHEHEAQASGFAQIIAAAMGFFSNLFDSVI